jgi:hypothetical protein
MTRVIAAVMAAAVFVLGFAVLDGQAKKHKHSHAIKIRAFARQVDLPKASDPDTAGVAGTFAICPKGYRAVGGGYDSTHISYVPEATLGLRSYTVVAINQIDQAGTLEAEVGCVPGKTGLSRASAARLGEELRADVARYRAEAARRP